MTPFPVVADVGTQLIAARAILKGHEIHHLPVMEHGEVKGVLSEAELELAEKLTGEPELPIGRVIHRDPVRVEVDEPLKVALRRMAQAGSDCAVVERNGRLAGVLTLSDISDVLLKLLPGPFVDQGGPVA
jgi:acetoin utilization protein AcuB